MRTWVVQGTGDEVCPEKFAEELVAGRATPRPRPRVDVDYA